MQNSESDPIATFQIYQLLENLDGCEKYLPGGSEEEMDATNAPTANIKTKVCSGVPVCNLICGPG